MHGSLKNHWNGQMDAPSRKVASHTLDLQNGQMEEALHWQLPILQRRRSSMKWTDGCPSRKVASHTLDLQNGQMEKTLHWQLPILQKEKKKIFYAFSSGTEEGGLCPKNP